MIITMTAREISDKGRWEKFCDIKGINYYAMNEGMPSDTEFKLTEEEAKEIGLLKE